MDAQSTTTTPTQRWTALVSGASFAGLATAYWLNRLGYRVTIVEIAARIRRGGTPVDIKGETVAILERMGLLDQAWAKRLPPRAFTFRDVYNEPLGAIDHTASPVDRPRDFEIHRDDLLDLLLDAVDGSVDILFDRSIVQLQEHAGHLSAVLSDGSRHDATLFFGCDGNRSKTRNLVFGDGDAASYFMGGYFYLKVVRETGLLPADTSEVFSVPGRTAMLNGYDDRTDICLAFRADSEIAYDYRDRARLRRLVHEHFDGLGWKVPQMLSHVDDEEDFYFDRATQIRMPSWSKGRAALVGDAGYCVSPVAGMGGSMAIIGAARLADALRQHPDDHAVAFQAYEDGLRPFVEEVQTRAATEGMAIVFPASAHELAERDRKIAADEIAL
jgi:2-polyprenyl-6-methoxyphenol hydroxylase-like FAD-dependent oxidoreductase